MAFFVYGARLNLLEIYEANGILRQIYLNVTAPQERLGATLEYTDLELDVSKIGSNTMIVDTDEFAAASLRFNYSDDLIQACYSAARLGVDIANEWQHGMEPRKALSQLASFVGT